MPQLRILVLYGVIIHSMLSGCHLPRLAMLSWRDACKSILHIALETVKSAAVLDISGNNMLERLPESLQARHYLSSTSFTSAAWLAAVDYHHCGFKNAMALHERSSFLPQLMGQRVKFCIKKALLAWCAWQTCVHASRSWVL